MVDSTNADSRSRGGRGAAKQRSEKLWRIGQAARQHEFSNPAESRKIIDGILNNIDSYDASPLTWHTLAMIAGRVDHDEARLIIIQAGLRQWPEDVDLLCEEMQMLASPAEGCNPRLGELKWKELVEMDRAKTGSYWRFWVYGAIHLARSLNSPKQALELLDEGLAHVDRDSLVDIFRSYRRVLVDSVPLRELSGMEDVSDYQSWATKVLEERLTLGLQLGLENGYVLAAELAQLYQERASIGTGDDNLKKALSYLETAERLYTGNRNHPIWDIYVSRARILMALRRYGDALKLLRSLPTQMAVDPSIHTMLSVASLMTGEPTGRDHSLERSPMEHVKSALPYLLDNNGEMLLRLASQNEDIANILLSVAQGLPRGRGGDSQ
jgi:tetratricopeptide (TPR) repeat protein